MRNGLSPWLGFRAVATVVVTICMMMMVVPGKAMPAHLASLEANAQMDLAAATGPIDPNSDETKKSMEAARKLSSSIVHYPYPGAFKLVVKNGEELYQARGELGQFGGTLRVATFGSGPKTFNYWASDEVESGGIGMLQYEPLVDVDAFNGQIYCRLARSFKVSPDKRTYTFVLRKGLKWSDGHPLTADDVVFTFGTIIKHGFGNSSLRDTIVVENEYPLVEKVDNLTVKFTTKKPFGPFLSQLNALLVAPKHILEPMTKKPPAEFGEFWSINCDPKTMVVSGPFKLSRYVPGQRVEMERNPNYSMVDRQGRRLPYLDKFIVAIVPDQNTEVIKFYGEELDFLDIRAVRGIDAALMKQREKFGNFTMYNLGPDDGTTFLMFNMCRRKNPKNNKYYVDPVKQQWFNNVYFRQAMNHAVNRRRIVDNVLRGVGLPLYTSESPASLFFDSSLKQYPQDLKYSEKLLAKGGFVKKGEQLFDSAGHRVEFTLITNSGNSQRDATCIMIVNDFKKLGIKVNYQPIDFNIMIDKTSNSLDWEAIVMALTGNKIEPYGGANVWKSDGRLHMFDQRLPDPDGTTRVKDARDWEVEIDKCFDQSALTLDDKKRHQLFNRYQEIVYQQQPYIYLYCMLDITSIRNSFGNYRPTPIGVYYTPKGSLHNIEEIYLKQRKH